MNGLFAWQLLGLRMAETMAASAQVIAHRTRRRNDAAQWLEMGSEKVEAAIRSGHAMSRHWPRLAGSGGFALWAAWARMLSSGLAPYHARASANATRARRAY